MQQSVGLGQPRLDCTVVMSHEPNHKRFRSASLASVHCHLTANIIIITGKYSRNNDDSELFVKNFFYFHVENPRIDALNFHYSLLLPGYCWIRHHPSFD